MAFTNFTEDIDELLNILDNAAIANDSMDGLDFAELMYGEGPAETKNVMERFRSSGNRRHIVEKLVMKNEGKPFYIYGVGEALKGLGDDSAKGFIAKREKFIRNHPRL